MSVIENNTDVPFVAVWMITYNHGKYIAQAIEGALNQKTDFKVKIFIGEDCSKDDTQKICADYAEKYPDKIELISTKQNNIKQNADNLWKATKTSGAKYIAICEGDDYWTDPYKLQKQADFLEANPGCSMCFTKVDEIDEMGMPLPSCFAEPTKDELTIKDMIMTWRAYTPVPTFFFRNILPYPMPSFYMNTSFGDAALLLLLTDKGKAKFLDENTAIYRRHSGGFSKSEDFIQNEYYIGYELYEEANKYFNYKYDDIFRRRLLEISKVILIYGSRNKSGFEKLRYAGRNFQKYFKYCGQINIKEIIYYLAILFFPSVLKLKSKK